MLREKWEAVIDGDCQTVEIGNGPKEMVLLANMINKSQAQENRLKREREAHSGIAQNVDGINGQLQTILDACGNPMMVLNNSHEIILANGAMARMLKFDQKGLIGKHVLDFPGSKSIVSACVKIIDKAFRSRKPSQEIVDMENGKINILAAVYDNGKNASMISVGLFPYEKERKNK